jgi:hypothetical protein
VYLFDNNGWCAIFNINKEVSRFCLPVLEYFMLSCRTHYLPREFSSIFLVAVYLIPQTDAGTKTTLNKLYKAINKQENAHPEEALLMANDFNAGTHTYPNQKPWITGNIRTELKARTASFKERDTNLDAYKQSCYGLQQTIKQAKSQYRTNIESY